LGSERYRDTSTELRVIAFALRKDHRVLDDVERDYFSIRAYSLFFDICSSLKSTMPQNMLRDKLGERFKEPDLYLPFILKCFQCKIDKITEKNVKVLIEKLKRLRYFRLSLEKVEELINQIGDGQEEEVRKTARQIATIGIKQKRVYTGELLKDFEERKEIIKARMEKPMVGIPTGVERFDRISGGIVKGELGIVIGETNIGKSIALENFALYPWERGYNVMYVNLEMPKSQVEFRADSRLAKLKYKKFRLGDFTEKDLIKWEKTIKEYRKKRKNFFEIVCLPRSCSPLDVEREAERIQDQYGKKIDLIVVDYLNIMRPNREGKGSSKLWENQVDIAWELKEIATDFQEEGIAIWTGNQVTDEAEGTSELKKKHIKYGRGIGEVAQIVLGLVQDQDDLLENVMQLQTLKLRDLHKINPIILRPNFDFMMLNQEEVRPGMRSLANI